MPSLHFGYAFVIGLTVATMPNTSRAPNLARRAALVVAGMSYPLLIFVAILATANHFVLDAAAGLVVASVGWHANALLANLLPLEDAVMDALHVHIPTRGEIAEEAKVGRVEEWWRQA